MPQHDRTIAKEHYNNWNNDRENSIKITKIRPMRRKKDEGWSYDWCNDYTVTGTELLSMKSKSNWN